MRFWLTLIVSVILISGVLSWLRMHQGAQIVNRTTAAAAAATEPPQMVFEGLRYDDKTVPVSGVANVLDVDAGVTVVGTTKHAELLIHNQGKGPLELKLMRTSCICLHDVTVSGEKLTSMDQGGGQPAVIKPGEKGSLKLGWSPKAEQLANGPNLRVTAAVMTNDPQFLEPLYLEVKTRLVLPSKEGK